MPKTTFVDGATVISQEIAQGWENVRWDLFDGATTKDAARSALGAVSADHAHAAAVQSNNGVGGSAGFIGAQDLERLRRTSSYPTSLSSSIPSNYTLAFIGPSGDVVNITFEALTAILGGGGGGGGGIGSGLLTGGEAEDTVSQVITGGEAEDTVGSVVAGGEAEDIVG